MPSDGLWNCLRADRLQWLPEIGIGYFPVRDAPYNAAYFEKYRRYDATPVGAQLTQMRMAFVARHYGGTDVTDVGIGGGLFVRSQPGAYGYDVNPSAVEMLRARGYWRDAYAEPSETLTFWDSLEHIHDPAPLLNNATQFVFISTPIYASCDDVLRSKHFRRDEHCWYFTDAGLCRFMLEHGFRLIECNAMEQEAGREAIESFAFRRINLTTGT